MRIKKWINILSCMLIGYCSLSLPILANEWNDKLYFNGFFTLDLTQTDEDINLISNSDQAISYEADKAHFRNSILGGQVTYQINDNLNAIVQAKAYSNSNDDVTATMDWAYLNYDIGNDTKIRAGKFQIPFLQGIELRNLSYTRLSARPLIPNSGAGGFNEFVGVELLKHYAIGSGNVDIQISAGQADHGRSVIDNKRIGLVSVRYQEGTFWLRSSLLHSKYRMETADGRLLTDSGDARMASIEAEYAVNRYVINGGYSTTRTDLTPNDTAYYVSVGYQLDNITPFFTLSRTNQLFERYQLPPLRPEQAPPPRTPGPRPPGPPQTPDGDSDVFSHALGVKYIFTDGYALKAQYDHIKMRDNSGVPIGKNLRANSLTLILEGVF